MDIMKESVWNSLSITLLVGTVLLIVIFGLIFILPNQILPAGMRPISIPPTLVLPSATDTPFQFPPTWTKVPARTTEAPTNTATPTIPATNTVYVLPSISPTKTATATLTRTNTGTAVSSKAVIINGTAKTFTKTPKPTKTKTPVPTRTPGGVPDFGAVDDVATVGPAPASVAINVLANDYNSTGTAIDIKDISVNPKHGSAEKISSNTIRYKPKAGFLGIDTFQYKMSDVGGLTDFAWVTVYVMDGSNQFPTDISLDANQIGENQPAGILIGNFTTTDDTTDQSMFHYSFVSGTGSTNNSLFNLSSGGVLKSKASYSYESTPTLSIRVRSTDPGGLYFEKAFTIFVNNVNEAPTITSASSTSGLTNKSFTFTIRATDPDATDTLTYHYGMDPAPTDDPSHTLPPDLNFVDNGNKTATISGIPRSTGIFFVYITVKDSGSPELSDTQTLRITITDGPTLTPTPVTPEPPPGP
jgi:hypothetical protein